MTILLGIIADEGTSTAAFEGSSIASLSSACVLSIDLLVWSFGDFCSRRDVETVTFTLLLLFFFKGSTEDSDASVDKALATESLDRF